MCVISTLISITFKGNINDTLPFDHLVNPKIHIRSQLYIFQRLFEFAHGSHLDHFLQQLALAIYLRFQVALSGYRTLAASGYTCSTSRQVPQRDPWDGSSDQAGQRKLRVADQLLVMWGGQVVVQPESHYLVTISSEWVRDLINDELLVQPIVGWYADTLVIAYRKVPSDCPTLGPI